MIIQSHKQLTVYIPIWWPVLDGQLRPLRLKASMGCWRDDNFPDNVSVGECGHRDQHYSIDLNMDTNAPIINR